jgi:D-sedoheptulose 7-phosphate isomerase
MQIDLYKDHFARFFEDPAIREGIVKAVELLRDTRRVFFIGNGGSNAISSHMMEDFMKMGGKQTLSFSDPALITCFANDYGYELALEKWVEFNFQEGDVLIAISSSGESKNILNAVNAFRNMGGKVITLSGFKSGNTLSGLGEVNFETPVSNYGIVESFHQVIVHSILDEMIAQ